MTDTQTGFIGLLQETLAMILMSTPLNKYSPQSMVISSVHFARTQGKRHWKCSCSMRLKMSVDEELLKIFLKNESQEKLSQLTFEQNLALMVGCTRYITSVGLKQEGLQLQSLSLLSLRLLRVLHFRPSLNMETSVQISERCTVLLRVRLSLKVMDHKLKLGL